MLALLLPLEGILLYKLWRRLLAGRDWRESILAAFVTIGGLITLSTELLGAFDAITGIAVRTFWLITLAISIIAIIWRRNKIALRPINLKIGSRFEWGILLSLSLYFIVTLFIALLAPPNTNDSLQYHMSRIMHWIVNRSVAFYPTPIDRQLWMPPFAEYSILHLFLLAGNDRFVNLVQWFSMAGSAIAASLIAGQIGVKPSGQWFAALFVVTVPMGILQSTSTQTDFVAAFWCLCITFFVISECRKYISGGKAGISINFILLGLSCSLAILTKGTVYAFIFPILLFYLIALIWKHFWKIIPGLVLIGGVCVLVLNAPAWLRNYSTYDSILGPGAGSLGSTNFSPEMVFSTALKDATNQLALPVGPLNKVMYIVVTKIHEILNININDLRTTLGDYRIRFSFHEDFAGNPGQFLFWIMSVIFILIFLIFRLRLSHLPPGSEQGRGILNSHIPIKWASAYSAILIAEYFLFALLFKWQFVNSRLLLPFLVAIGPLAGWISEAIRPRIAQVVLTSLFAIAGLPYLFANPSRPLINVGENESILLASRTDVQFYNSPEIRDGFISVVAAANGYDTGSIGLELDSSTPEYLIWYLLTASHMPIDRVENLTSTPETSRLIDPAYRPSVVFCNICTLIMAENNYQQVYNRGSLQLFVKSSEP